MPERFICGSCGSEMERIECPEKRKDCQVVHVFCKKCQRRCFDHGNV